MMKKYSMAQLEHLLGVDRANLYYAIRAGIAGPIERYRGRYLYTEEVLARLREWIERRPARGLPWRDNTSADQAEARMVDGRRGYRIKELPE